MGLQKLGITLAEQCARYANACGKTNTLCTKPVHVQNVEEFILLLKGKKSERICMYIKGGKQVGEIRYNITQGAMARYPEYYLQDSGTFQKTLKPSIFVSHLEGQQCGTELMKVACRDAQRLTEGRMVLDAQSIDGLTSPDAFYYKLGLRKLNPKENELIKSYIERRERIPVDIFSDRMYLPRENITHLLSYSRKNV